MGQLKTSLRSRYLAIGAVLVLGLTGCGGGEESGDATVSDTSSESPQQAASAPPAPDAAETREGGDTAGTEDPGSSNMDERIAGLEEDSKKALDQLQEVADGIDQSDVDQIAKAPGVSKGIATLTFANGQELSTEVLCYLEPQKIAAQEILYSASSAMNPYFSISEFGGDSLIAGASASWMEAEDVLAPTLSWQAMGAMGDFEATLEGNTITGSGTFIEDETGESQHGDVLVECQ